MAPHLIRGGLAALVAIGLEAPLATAQPAPSGATPTEVRIPAGATTLHARVVGRGEPVIVLHGGPDFDHAYFLPELDRLADAFRLIYYDQRGRGRSAEDVRPEDVSLASEMEDLDTVRRHFGLEAPTLLGHSWGAVLALEYALRHPTRVSRLVLMNPAPASARDLVLLRDFYLERLGTEMARQREILESAAYRAGDPEAVTERYRIHFRPALHRAEDHERLMARMRAAFIQQGSEGILRARAVEERLYRDTWQRPGYDLLPGLAELRIPTLVIAGEDDFIPIRVADNIARAIPGARLVTIPDCGHFGFLECADDVRSAIEELPRR